MLTPSMPNIVSLIQPLRKRVSPVKWFERAIGAMIILQIITVLALWLVAALRKHHKHEQSFPHIEFEEVLVGENRVQLYDYGYKLYRDMLAAIDGARENIYIESYIWKGDEVGQEFKEHLAKKAAEGVHVYVIFDRFANLIVPQAFKVFPSTIHLIKYQSFHSPWHLLDPRRYALDHRKLLIVDGAIGFIGGYNIGALYAAKWRDTHLRICGPAAANLAHSFTSFWNRFCRDSEKINQHYPMQFDPLINIRHNDALRLTFPIRDMYIDAVDRAEHFILLTNAYFVPDHFLLEALGAAARRGVDVRILVPWMSNHIVVDWLARGYFRSCLEAGIRVFGYKHTMLHAKTCTIDGEWSTIGTANLDRLSSIGNYEINVEIYSSELAEQMHELFKCDTADMFELTLEEWLKRPWYSKLSERILTPLRYIL